MAGTSVSSIASNRENFSDRLESSALISSAEEELDDLDDLLEGSLLGVTFLLVATF